MLMGALAIFTLVAVMGLSIIPSIWRGYPVEAGYPLLHGAASLLGSALVILAALAGDTRLYLNIGLAVVIILLGVTMGVFAKRGKKPPKGIVITHVGLVVACYGILGFFTFNPGVELL